ncbi:MAG: hypothetical protein ACPG7F_12895 [Aggregatilineales bacterium]
MTTNHHSVHPTGQELTAVNQNAPLSELDTAITNIIGTDDTNPLYRLGASTELTIISGAVTITKSLHTIDTQSDAASDDLDTISGGTNGDTIWISANNAARTVVLKHGTGNIQTWDGTDISLDETRKILQLKFDGTNWKVVSIIGAGGGGGGSVSVAIIEHHEASNGHAGGTSATTWNTRPITRIASDPDSIVTIDTANDDFTPDSGNYLIIVSASLFASGFGRLRLYNVTGTSVEFQGVNSRPASTDSNTDSLTGYLVANGTDEFRVEHYSSAAKAVDGLGDAANNGDEEIYMQITLIKIG